MPVASAKPLSLTKLKQPSLSRSVASFLRTRGCALKRGRFESTRAAPSNHSCTRRATVHTQNYSALNHNSPASTALKAGLFQHGITHFTPYMGLSFTGGMSPPFSQRTETLTGASLGNSITALYITVCRAVFLILFSIAIRIA